MKSLVTVVLIAISINVVAQVKDPSYKWGISVDQRLRVGNSSVGGYWYPLSLFATISNDKNQFEFGPQIYLGAFQRRFEKRGYEAGVGFNYKYYPNGNLNRFSGYLAPSLLLQVGKEEFSVEQYNSLTGSYFGRGIRKTFYALIGIGYGIELRILDKMYIGTDLRFFGGFGPSKTVKEFKQSELNSTLTTNYYHFYAQVGISIGYRF